MATPNHYEILDVHPEATQGEIKRAYRRLVKQFHPDTNPDTQGSHDQIAQINAAYEVLGDPHHRRSYDHQLYAPYYAFEERSPHQRTHQQRAKDAQTQYQQRRHAGQNTDEHLQAWLKRIYTPVNRYLRLILDPLADQIDQLAADPFDDELMGEFQDYLQDCRQWHCQAQQCFHSMPNPANLAGVAAHLYYCLNQVNDGIEELERFTLSYDDHYLHTGQELFRIARGLRGEAAGAIKEIA